MNGVTFTTECPTLLHLPPRSTAAAQIPIQAEGHLFPKGWVGLVCNCERPFYDGKMSHGEETERSMDFNCMFNDPGTSVNAAEIRRHTKALRVPPPSPTLHLCVSIFTVRPPK